MSSRFRRILAVVLGFVVGSIVNMAVLMLGMKIIPAPPGADVTTSEGLAASIHLFEPKHFLFPFLAHALGTLVGAMTAMRLTPNRTPGPTYAVGIAFLIAGIANVCMLPAPLWFEVLDVVAAYLPMAWIGSRIATRANREDSK